MTENTDELRRPCCANCHFFVLGVVRDQGRTVIPSVDQRLRDYLFGRPQKAHDRKHDEKRLLKDIDHENPALRCYQQFWDLRIMKSQTLKTFKDFARKNRGHSCAFLSYSPGMLVENAVMLQGLKVAQEASRKTEGHVIIAIFISILALMVTAAALFWNVWTYYHPRSDPHAPAPTHAPSETPAAPSSP